MRLLTNRAVPAGFLSLSPVARRRPGQQENLIPSKFLSARRSTIKVVNTDSQLLMTCSHRSTVLLPCAVAIATLLVACGGPRNVIPPGVQPDRFLFESRSH